MVSSSTEQLAYRLDALLYTDNGSLLVYAFILYAWVAIDHTILCMIMKEYVLFTE